jgi:hypothetical protein
MTVLWARTEARHRGCDALSRIGRAAGGLVLAAVAVPVAVLLPLFWLETVLPPEAHLASVLGPAMTLVLIALALTALVNVAGGLAVAVRGAVAIGRRSRRAS